MEDSVKDMVTLQDALKDLGVSYQTLVRWRRAGKIRYVEFPRQRYRYYREDIDKILKEGF
jgi:excisionase family DNA binding protein